MCDMAHISGLVAAQVSQQRSSSSSSSVRLFFLAILLSVLECLSVLSFVLVAVAAS
jgi:hypothetical protein